MRRSDVVEIIDGTHPTAGRGVALSHQALIVVSAIAIALETLPGLPFWAQTALLRLELVVLSIFAAEYVVRVICSPRPLRYMFSFWGLVDLAACLPLLTLLSPQWAAVRSLRLLRLFRVLKLLHTNRALIRLEKALSENRGELGVFALLAFIILYIAAVGIYIFEHEAQPEAFTSIPVSLWWAVVSFTTVGYGDLYPITPEGRIFTAAILFVGLGVIAVPTAIITSALIQGDLKHKIEDEVEEDLRGDLQKDRRRPERPLHRKPTRRQ